MKGMKEEGREKVKTPFSLNREKKKKGKKSAQLLESIFRNY